MIGTTATTPTRPNEVGQIPPIASGEFGIVPTQQRPGADNAALMQLAIHWGITSVVWINEEGRGEDADPSLLVGNSRGRSRTLQLTYPLAGQA